ncbi:MAG: YARHG domain-containing protein [Treponema sp.]|nr:YARHG domain-containing protein [Treponema sp.]
MKKRSLLFLLFFSLITKAFSLSIEEAENLIKENDITWDIVQKQVTNIVNCKDGYFIIAEEDAFTGYVYYFFKNRLVKKYPCMNLFENNELGNLECVKIKKSDSFLADFNYDEEPDIMLYSLSSHYYGFNIYNYTDNSDSLLTVLFNNKDFTDDNYQTVLKRLSFCIVNGRRGIKLASIDYSVLRNNEFHVGLKEKGNDIFFTWSPPAKRYIIDETVTQKQLANAYCPEDYFAYNGLQFSKLDSKLTDSDLKDLDKAQLRLMRNAVYARHGRTFKSVDLQSLWECYTWYKKNPDYSDVLLTKTDKYNIELIQKYEAKK